jgi:hypothetical protein
MGISLYTQCVPPIRVTQNYDAITTSGPILAAEWSSPIIATAKEQKAEIDAYQKDTS